MSFLRSLNVENVPENATILFNFFKTFENWGFFKKNGGFFEQKFDFFDSAKASNIAVECDSNEKKILKALKVGVFSKNKMGFSNIKS